MPQPRLKYLVAAVAAVLALPGVASAQWVTVKGQVVLPTAKAPAAQLGVENVTVDKAVCLKNGNLDKNILVINPKNNGVKNVVVWLRPNNPNRKATFTPEQVKPELANPAPKTHEIDQPCCQFEPRILAVRAGDTLKIKNSATINHNIKYDGANAFNINLPPGMSHTTKQPIELTGSPIPFSCSIHPWMAGKVRVFDHPYYAITDADGNFEIKDAPAGDFCLVYWHELGLHKGRQGILGFPEKLVAPVTQVKPIELELPQ